MTNLFPSAAVCPGGKIIILQKYNLYKSSLSREKYMITDAFFICPGCGNNKKFKIFTSSFQVIKQAPEIGKRIDESSILPNLQQKDNYVECQLCFKRYEYDNASIIGKKYLYTIQKLNKKMSNAPLSFFNPGDDIP